MGTRYPAAGAAHLRPEEPVALQAALEALDAWRRSPTTVRRRRLRAAFRRLVEAHGAPGASLRLDVEPLPRLEMSVGTLARASSRPPGLTDVELRSADGHRLGALRIASESDQRSRAILAAVIGLTVDAAWARAREQTGTERLAALDAATRAIAGVLTLDLVLQIVVDRVKELVGAEYAALGIIDEEGVIDRFITSGLSKAERDLLGAPPRGRGVLGLVIREARSIRIADLANDPRRYPDLPAHHPIMHSFLGVPVTVKGRSIGNLYLTNKRATPEFTEDDQRLVEIFALHAGIAIENARLHEQVQRLAVVDERERIGRDLHDGIIQSIYAVGLSLEDVPELMDEDPSEARARIERAIESLDLTIRDIRNFIFGLRPELLDGVDLMSGLTAVADEFRVNTLIDVDFTEPARAVPGIGSDAAAVALRLASEATVQLLAIAREALTNVARHARASRVTISVGARDGEVRLTIADNGLGFDPEAVVRPGHQGLANMRERLIELGGRLEIETNLGSGARIIAVVPQSIAPRNRAPEIEGLPSSDVSP